MSRSLNGSKETEQKASWRAERPRGIDTEKCISRQRLTTGLTHRRVIYTQRSQRLEFSCDGDELAIVGFDGMVERSGRSVQADKATVMVGMRIHIVANALRAVGQRGIDRVLSARLKKNRIL